MFISLLLCHVARRRAAAKEPLRIRIVCRDGKTTGVQITEDLIQRRWLSYVRINSLTSLSIAGIWPYAEVNGGRYSDGGKERRSPNLSVP